MHSANLDHLFPQNLGVLMDREEALRDFIREPVSFYLWRPCTVRVLIVVDGLDFSPSNGFGLSQFVTTILNTGWYVRFAITLADIRNVNVAAQGMMPGEPRIADRIAGFRFDNTDHFAPDRFDVVFLFGIAETYQFFPGRGQATLTDAELQAIGEFQNGGGGLFATGDHAALGRALCSRVARARNMRLWDSKNNALGEDMVSMTGRYRNDTNRIGHDSTSEFNDQSDDIPQQIDPVFYTRRSFIFRYRFPHPLLCGPRGVIRVMPDHPHEGECIVPPDTSLNVQFTGKLGAEYPPGSGGGAQPFPEIISYNRVPAGNVASVDPDRLTDDKSPTVGQRFPGISAYDGHRAGIGRVVCDSTWHHFVNINLTGEANGDSLRDRHAGARRRAVLSGHDRRGDVRGGLRASLDPFLRSARDGRSLPGPGATLPHRRAGRRADAHELPGGDGSSLSAPQADRSGRLSPCGPLQPDRHRPSGGGDDLPVAADPRRRAAGGFSCPAAPLRRLQSHGAVLRSVLRLDRVAPAALRLAARLDRRVDDAGRRRVRLRRLR